MPFLTRTNCSRKVREIEPWSLTPAPPYQSHGAKKWFGQFSRHFTQFLEDKEDKGEKEGKEEKEYKEETKETEEKE